MPPKQATPYQKFEALMRELFQMDMADLDFGIYRIFNMKRREIDAFLQKELPTRVDAAFASEAGQEVEAIRAELAKTAGELRQNISEDAVGADGTLKPEHAGTKLGKKYEEVRRQLAGVETTEEQKAEIFIHLVNFFSRYYDEADFIPRRYIGSGTKYMVPYNGEEVMLHWANRDQYYIKTGEYFRDYTFRLDGPGMLPFDFTVRFTMARANTAKDNVKGKKRFFFPLGKEASADDKTLVIPFEYRLPDEKEEKKYDLGKGEGQANILLAQLDACLAPVRDNAVKDILIRAQDGTKPEAQSEQLLVRRMLHFCRKNTTDYFIHKDLRGFLTSELEYYIKDQFIHIDDIAGDALVQLRKLRVFRDIAGLLVAFLADIEELQKRLWLKKKFVLGAHWCATLDRVPEALYPAICASDAQREEWVRLYGIDTLKKSGEDPGYSKPLKPAFLKAHPCMMVDTKFFDEAFKQTLLGDETMHTVDAESGERKGLDESADGLLVHSENFQALRLLQERYREQVKCVYIDPPYNTGEDEFPYKDNYQHSSWASMITDRLDLARCYIQEKGFLFCSIGSQEVGNLKKIVEEVYHQENFLSLVTRIQKTASDKGSFFAPSIDYVICSAKLKEKADEFSGDVDITLYKKIETEGPKKGQKYRDDVAFYQSSLDARPNQRYFIKCPDGSFVIPPGSTMPSEKKDGAKIIPNKADGVWRWSDETFTLQRSLLVFKQTKTSPLLNENGEQARYNIYTKSYLEERQLKGTTPRDVWVDFINRKGADLIKTFGISYPYSKPIELIQYICNISNSSCDYLIFDFFAGSGTTAHSLIKLNRQDEGKRKYILFEMGNYFTTVLKPRIQKVVYADTWKEGKPVTPETGISHAFKYFDLESYEDALHNTLRAAPAGGGAGITGQVRYLLERAGGVSLQLEKFDHPFDYAIEVLTDDGPVQRPVDLVETFNYLYGIVVERYRYPANGTRQYRLVQGHTLKGKGVWVLWRDMAGLDKPKALEAERDFLEALAKEAPAGTTLLINGDTAARGFQSLDGLFRTLMFSGSGE